MSGVRRLRVDAYRGDEEKSIHLALQQGTTADGVWTGAFQFSQHDNSGSWVLRLFEITDGAGNDIFYIRNIGAAPNEPYDPRLHPDWQQTFDVSGHRRRPTCGRGIRRF